MIRIGHFSDLHSNIARITGAESVDVWVCTGDFFPNATRGDRAVEEPFQTEWFTSVKDELFVRLGGRPLIWVEGNHDYVSLAKLLREHGYAGQVWDLADGPVDFGGHRFAGFGEIPWIEGEWNGETHDLRPLVDRAFDQDPTILVTHSPASGILDEVGGGHGDGIRPLTIALTYRPHRIVLSLCGHIHEQGGKRIEMMGVLFVNSACCTQLIELRD